MHTAALCVVFVIRHRLLHVLDCTIAMHSGAGKMSRTGKILFQNVRSLNLRGSLFDNTI